MDEKVYSLKVLIRQLHESALSAGVYGGFQIAKAQPGRSALEDMNEKNRTQGERLIRFRALLSECKRLSEEL